jgi:hypothetical protein
MWFFEPEDDGSSLFHNAGIHLPQFIASLPKNHNYKKSCKFSERSVSPHKTSGSYLTPHNFHVEITYTGKLNKGQVASTDNIKFHENLPNGSKRTRVAIHWNTNIPYACSY